MLPQQFRTKDIEVAIDSSGSYPFARVINLSGVIDCEEVPMFQRNSGMLAISSSVSLVFRFMIGIFVLRVMATAKEHPINKGDEIAFYFTDNTSIILEFRTAGYRDGKRKGMSAGLSIVQALALGERLINRIEIRKSTGNAVWTFEFAPCNIYSDPLDGAEIVQLIIHRLASLRNSLPPE